MASQDARFASYTADFDRSTRNLQRAREEALKMRGYQSAATRVKLHEEFTKRNNGLVTYDWQIDVSEALLLGLDCSVIAGTGAGKTMPFVMPLFVESDKIIIIISPLNALEEDQESRFKKMGISAVAVNGDTYSNKIHQELEKLQHHVIITSPELCLEHDRFRQLLNSTKFAEKICAVIIDEAHCISQWGEQFRALYAELGTLRAFVPHKVPFLVTSATLPPLVLAQVRASVHMQAESSYHVHLGTDRPNIAWFVRQMSGGKKDFESLAFLIPHATDGELMELIQTMVFFDDINVALEALKWIRTRLPPELRDQVAVYNSRRSKRAKHHVLEGYRKGQIKILLTTEAAGMGCDLPHVEQVVQFMVPKSMSIWSQRAGRGGRNPQIHARAILLVQPSVFQEVKSVKGVELEEGDVKYRKDVEEGLREWIETEGCRRNNSDLYFSDGLPRKKPTGICCDNCLRKVDPNHPLLALSLVPLPERPISPCSDTEDSPCQEPDENGKRPMAEGARVANRRDDHLKGARDLLEKYRMTTWLDMYRRRPWGHQCFLSDVLITAFATKARLSTIEDLIGAGWSPTHARKHGNEILGMLKLYDSKFYGEREGERLRKAEQRKQEMAKRRAAKREAVVAERARKRAEPKTPRPSRAKKTLKVKEALTDSTVHLNSPLSVSTLPLSTPYRGLENIPLQLPSPQIPQLPVHFHTHYLPHTYTPSPVAHGSSHATLPLTPLQRSYVTTPACHPSTPLSYPHPPLPHRYLQPPESIPITAQLAPAHFYAGCYPNPFLYLTTNQSHIN